jgi:hypothetical protein
MQDQNIVPNGGGQVNIDLPRICDIDCSISGSNGDNQLWATARQLACCTADFELYRQWMLEYNRTRCKPPWSERRVAYYIHKEWRLAHGDELGEVYLPPVDNRPHVKGSKVSFKRLDELAGNALGMYARLLAFLRPKRKAIPSSEAIIDRLYPGNPWICRAAGSQRWARTDTRESFRGVEKEMEWIVPSPMSKMTGFAYSTGKSDSPRCKENAGPRVYLVIEFDFGKTFAKHLEAWAAKGISSRDVQAYLIHHLATTGEPRRWPFMIVDSGGKSLHSWFQISKKFSEQNALDLLARAIPLGADKGGDEPERFFRFPGGTRKSENNQPQPVLFYDQKRLV